MRHRSARRRGPARRQPEPSPAAANQWRPPPATDDWSPARHRLTPRLRSERDAVSRGAAIDFFRSNQYVSQKDWRCCPNSDTRPTKLGQQVDSDHRLKGDAPSGGHKSAQKPPERPEGQSLEPGHRSAIPKPRQSSTCKTDFPLPSRHCSGWGGSRARVTKTLSTLLVQHGRAPCFGW